MLLLVLTSYIFSQTLVIILKCRIYNIDNFLFLHLKHIILLSVHVCMPAEVVTKVFFC